MNRSSFSPAGRKQIKYTDFEKPDLLETLEALGITDLTYHDGGGRPYYNGPCPLHESDSGNYTNFIVYPEIQRCHCKSCHDELMDVIALWMALRKVDFKTAKAEICVPVPPEQAILRTLKMTHTNIGDLRFYAERMYNLFERWDYSQALTLVLKVQEALEQEQYTLADRWLVSGDV